MFRETFQPECESLRTLAFKEIKFYYSVYILEALLVGKFNFDESKAFSSLILKSRRCGFQMWRNVSSWY
jgi:hypothetical protein